MIHLSNDPSMFTLKPLQAPEARLAFPLVACRYPEVSLRRWTDFVRRCERGGVDRLIGLVDGHGRHHALFGYRVTPARKLRVCHIATFQLAGDAIQRAFLATLDALARDHSCREVTIEPWAPDGRRSPVRALPFPRGRRLLSFAPAVETRTPLN